MKKEIAENLSFLLRNKVDQRKVHLHKVNQYDNFDPYQKDPLSLVIRRVCKCHWDYEE